MPKKSGLSDREIARRRKWMELTRTLLLRPKEEQVDLDDQLLKAMTQLRKDAFVLKKKINEKRRQRIDEYNPLVPLQWQVGDEGFVFLLNSDLDPICTAAFEAKGRPRLGQVDSGWVNDVREDIERRLKASDARDNQAIDQWMAGKLQEDPPGLPGALETLRDTCGGDWFAAKRRFTDDPVTRNLPMMWKLIRFRKETVDGTITDAAAAVGCDDIIAKSVGSQNLTSDYDLTLSTESGSGLEIEVIAEFNQRIQRLLGKQPGVCFDTNLYAKDFLKVKGNVVGVDHEDSGDIDVAIELLTTDRGDQDVAALTKMRQYMTQDEWDDYLDELVTGGGLTKKEKLEITTQLEEVDALYMLKLDAEVRGFFKAYWAQRQDELIGRPRNAVIEGYHDGFETYKRDGLLTYQENLPELAHGLEHEDPNLMLMVRNNEYLARMREVRRIQLAQAECQQAHDSLKASVENALNIDGLEHVSDKTKAALRDKTRKKQIAFLLHHIDGLKAQARKLTGDANFFAAEAYLSEGPLQHIVNGKQSDNPEVFDKLKPEHFLESINEQTGDFFKDVDHYAVSLEHPEGVALYQCSKYLARMLEGIAKLALKPGFRDIESKLAIIGKWGGDADDTRKAIEDKLLPIRGAKGEFAGMTTDQKADEARDRSDAIFGYTGSTIAMLKADVRALSLELNRILRVAIKMRAGGKELRSAMKHREPTSDESQ